MTVVQHSATVCFGSVLSWGYLKNWVRHDKLFQWKPAPAEFRQPMATGSKGAFRRWHIFTQSCTLCAFLIRWSVISSSGFVYICSKDGIGIPFSLDEWSWKSCAVPRFVSPLFPRCKCNRMVVRDIILLILLHSRNASDISGCGLSKGRLLWAYALKLVSLSSLMQHDAGFCILII